MFTHFNSLQAGPPPIQLPDAKPHAAAPPASASSEAKEEDEFQSLEPTKGEEFNSSAVHGNLSPEKTTAANSTFTATTTPTKVPEQLPEATAASAVLTPVGSCKPFFSSTPAVASDIPNKDAFKISEISPSKTVDKTVCVEEKVVDNATSQAVIGASSPVAEKVVSGEVNSEDSVQAIVDDVCTEAKSQADVTMEVASPAKATDVIQENISKSSSAFEILSHDLKEKTQPFSSTSSPPVDPQQPLQTAVETDPSLSNPEDDQLPDLVRVNPPPSAPATPTALHHKASTAAAGSPALPSISRPCVSSLEASFTGSSTKLPADEIGKDSTPEFEEEEDRLIQQEKLEGICKLANEVNCSNLIEKEIHALTCLLPFLCHSKWTIFSMPNPPWSNRFP